MTEDKEPHDDYVFTFGKHIGKTLTQVLIEDPSYIAFLTSTKDSTFYATIGKFYINKLKYYIDLNSK